MQNFSFCSFLFFENDFLERIMQQSLWICYFPPFSCFNVFSLCFSFLYFSFYNFSLSMTHTTKKNLSFLPDLRSSVYLFCNTWKKSKNHYFKKSKNKNLFSFFVSMFWSTNSSIMQTTNTFRFFVRVAILHLILLKDFIVLLKCSFLLSSPRPLSSKK